MVFGLRRKGQGNDGKPEFKPTEVERALVEPYIQNREVPLMEVKGLLLKDDSISEDRRGPLGEWLRDFRANNPQLPGVERKIDF